MKHIGWCLDMIQIVMARIPNEVNSEENKKLAQSLLDDVQEYANTLEALIKNPKFRKILERLEKVPIKEVTEQAHNIEELFKDFEHMLYVLDLYIKELNYIIKNNPAQWSQKADQITLMIDQKFGGEMGELRKEFLIALHTKSELAEVVADERHLAEFLK
jgi:hypothetical protein